MESSVWFNQVSVAQMSPNEREAKQQKHNENDDLGEAEWQTNCRKRRKH